MLTATACALSLLLCSCSGGGPKDELLASAEKVSASDISKTILDNKVKAEQQYGGHILAATGYVYNIGSNAVYFGNVKASISKDDLAKLSKEQCITVVGVAEKKR